MTAAWEPTPLSRVECSVRWILVIPLVAGCTAPSPASPTLIIAVEPEPASVSLAPCEEPTSTAAPVILPMPETGPCPSAPCLRPLRVAVFNPNDTPIYITETHAGDEDEGSLMLTYDPVVVVPPGERLRMPREPHVRPSMLQRIRVVYTDGFGHERVAEAPNTPGHAHVSLWAGVDPVCIRPSPPAAPTLVLSSTEREQGQRTVHIHNDSPHRVRLLEASVVSPRGYTTMFGWYSNMHYVQPGESVPLPSNYAFDHEGEHQLRVAYVDGWARRHEALLVVVSK